MSAKLLAYFLSLNQDIFQTNLNDKFRGKSHSLVCVCVSAACRRTQSHIHEPISDFLLPLNEGALQFVDITCIRSRNKSLLK